MANEKDYVDFSNDFRGFFSISDIDLCVDTLSEVLCKIQRSRFRNLIMDMGDSGMFFFCVDPVMCKKVKHALARVSDEMSGYPGCSL